MNDLFSKQVGSRFAFLAFFASLFLFFTPFEQSGSNPTMFPKYFVTGISIFLLIPLLAIRRIRLRASSVLALIVLVTIIFHSLVIKPVPGQFALLISANICLAIILYEASFIWGREFESAVSWVLMINAIVIAVQAFLFYVWSHEIFDFHRLIFGSDSRFVEDYLNIARFSGIQVEPGTYANYIACLLAILILCSAFSQKILWMSFISIISIFLTNSGSSMYFVPVLLVLVAFVGRKKIRPFHIGILAAAIFVYLHSSGVLAHLEDRFLDHDDGSLSHRIEGINAYLATTVEEKIIGVGFGADPCVRCFYQDIGVTFNLLTRGGIIVALALALMLLRSMTVNGILLSALLFLIPLNEKMSFYEAPIWMFILFATTGLRDSRSSNVASEDTARLQFASD
jgi:hypothetical protein